MHMVLTADGRCGTTDATVLWKGRLEDVSINDPRGSNVIYSKLVRSHSPIPPTLGGADGERSGRSPPASPVQLTFYYSKRNGSGASRSAAVVGEAPGDDYPSSFSFPWEKSILSLSFSALEVVYFQPLWLEAIDYLWEGVLGSAVWGGAVGTGCADYSGEFSPFLGGGGGVGVHFIFYQSLNYKSNIFVVTFA